MLDAIKPLIESGLINEDVAGELNTAWESKLNEARDQVRGELRQEFANRYEHDRSVMVEALDKMVTESLSEEIREFNEETSLGLDHLHILERLSCAEEQYVGTNGINYKHIYYLASSDDELELTINNDNQIYEIGDMGWFTIPDAIEKIRSYNDKKIKMIHQIYFFLINLIIDISNSSKKKTIEI